MIMPELDIVEVNEKVGFVLAKIDNQTFSKLTEEVWEIQNKNFIGANKSNHRLVGHLQREYQLYKNFDLYNTVLTALAGVYKEKMPEYLESITITKNNYPITLDTLWVNFQKKYEFNPIHNHSGIFSFVIWVKIPYNLQDELKMFSESSKPSTSLFRFHYVNKTTIETWSINIDKYNEGQIAFFPSNLNHSVNPFYTSDDYRISISGNMRIDI